jgi:23S rRNA (uracil1939-C5)-methyltransferase
LVLGAPGLPSQTNQGQCFVAAAAPGEKLEVEFQKTRRRDDSPQLARLVRVIEPARARVSFPCATLERCGACIMQPLRYREQIAAKKRALKTLLSRVQKKLPEPAMTGLSNPFGYRTKLMMSAFGKPGRLQLGFYTRGTFTPFSAMGCPIQHPLTLAMAANVLSLLQRHDVEASPFPKGSFGTRRKKGDGWLHGIMVRADPHDHQSEITLLGSKQDVPKALTDQLAAIPSVVGVHNCVSRERSSYPLDGEFFLLAGQPRMPFYTHQQRFDLSPGSFVQTTSEGADLLATTVLDFLPETIDGLADLYGGVGLFSRLSRARWARALVVESNPHANGDLKQALKKDPELREVAGNLRLVAKRVEQADKELEGFNPTVAIVDPPRKGCHPRVIELLGELPIEHLVYVSCGAEALERELPQLLRAGYQATAISAVDMFPHTTHLEVVIKLKRD